MSLEDLVKRRITSHVPIYTLSINCRNTPRTTELVHLLAGLDPGYTRTLRPDDKVLPRIDYYSNALHQTELLTATLDGLYKDGYEGNAITILSPRNQSACAASALNTTPWRDRVRPFDRLKPRYIGYGTIKAFKGLESSVVIVTDVEQIRGAMAMSLFYIAITRALHRLIILVDESAKAEIIETALQLAASQDFHREGIR